MACGARGPGFDSRLRHLNFQRLVYLLLPSRDMVEIPLKRRKSSIQPTNQPTSKLILLRKLKDNKTDCFKGPWGRGVVVRGRQYLFAKGMNPRVAIELQSINSYKDFICTTWCTIKKLYGRHVFCGCVLTLFESDLCNVKEIIPMARYQCQNDWF